MRGADVVGRVGGLAVALGVGIAVAGGAGTAQATPDEDAGGRQSASASTAAEGSRPSGGRGPARQAGEADRSQRRTTPADSDAPVAPRPVTVSVPDRAVPVPAAAARRAGTVLAPEAEAPAAPQPSANQPSANQPGAPVVSAAVALLPTAAPVADLRASAQPIAARIRDTVRGALPATGPLPTGPAESPVSWMVAAAARRGDLRALASATGTERGNPVAELFFNQTPTMNPSRTGQDSQSVVTGDLNINDPDSLVEVYTITVAPQRGTVEIDADGRYTYTPNPEYSRTGTTDSFTVSVSDAESGFHIHGIGGLLNLLTFGLLGDSGHSSTATVAVVVDPRNTAPEASVTVAEPNPVTGLVTGAVIGTDADGDALTYTGSTTTSKGAVTVAADGTFTYLPTVDARHDAALLVATEVDKTDTFTVTVSDIYGGVTNALVRVGISPLNEPPVGGVTVGSPDPATGVVRGRVSATDPEGDPLTYTGSTTTAKGTVVVAADGTFTYTPTAAARHAAAKLTAGVAQKTDTFTVTVSDGSTGGTVDFAVTVAISPTNTAPSVTAAPTVGTPDATTGLVTGRIFASDADGDPLSYSAAPAKGSISFTSSGNFSYTPTALARQQAASGGATSETFTVTIADGYGGTAPQALTVGIAPALAPPALSFAFTYGSGSDLWSAEARSALESAAASLASYFVVDSPRIITVSVLGSNSPSSSNLAYASVGFTSYSAGYYGTVVQSKILTGVDSNGSTADAVISYNWGQPWALGNSVPGNRYDFKAVAIHELLHTVGFITGAEGVSNDRNWTTYDRFLTTADGTPVINGSYNVIGGYAGNFTGANGGLYFTGPNAGRVQLYTPGSWAAGSSVSHVNQLDGYVMNPFYSTGLGPRVLNATEVGILRDLGYTVNNSPGVAAFVVLLLVGLRRRSKGR